MKKTYFFLAGLFLSLLLVGCEKEPIVVVHPDPVISFIALPSTTPEYLSSCKVNWNVTGEFKEVSVYVNKIKISSKPNDSYDIDSLKGKQEVVIICVTENGKTIEGSLVVTPKLQVPAPTVRISANPLVVKYRGNSTFNIALEYVDSIETNIPGLSKSGMSQTFIAQGLTSTGNYFVRGYGKGGEIAYDSVNIEVLPPADEDLLSYFGSWMWIFSRDSPTPNIGPWVVSLTAEDFPCLADDILTFFPDQTVKVDKGEILCGSEPRMWTGEWKLNGNKINGFGERTLIKVSTDTLVCRYESIKVYADSVGKIWIEDTYVHPKF